MSAVEGKSIAIVGGGLGGPMRRKCLNVYSTSQRTQWQTRMCSMRRMPAKELWLYFAVSVGAGPVPPATEACRKTARSSTAMKERDDISYRCSK